MEEGEFLEVGSNRRCPSCSKSILPPRKISSHTPSSIIRMQEVEEVVFGVDPRGRLP